MSLVLYKCVMAKKKGVALTKTAIDTLCEEILSEDIAFAQGLTEVMRTFIDKKARIRNYGELRTVQEVRKALLGKQDLEDLLGDVHSIEVKFVKAT